jgi:hypothetical protein
MLSVEEVGGKDGVLPLDIILVYTHDIMHVIAEDYPLCTSIFTQKSQLRLHNSMHWAAFSVVWKDIKAHKEGDVVESGKSEAQKVVETIGAGGLFWTWCCF